MRQVFLPGSVTFWFLAVLSAAAPTMAVAGDSITFNYTGQLVSTYVALNPFGETEITIEAIGAMGGNSPSYDGPSDVIKQTTAGGEGEEVIATFNIENSTHVPLQGDLPVQVWVGGAGGTPQYQYGDNPSTSTQLFCNTTTNPGGFGFARGGRGGFGSLYGGCGGGGGGATAVTLNGDLMVVAGGGGGAGGPPGIPLADNENTFGEDQGAGGYDGSQAQGAPGGGGAAGGCAGCETDASAADGATPGTLVILGGGGGGGGGGCCAAGTVNPLYGGGGAAGTVDGGGGGGEGASFIAPYIFFPSNESMSPYGNYTGPGNGEVIITATYLAGAAVPEPPSLALLGLGALLWVWARGRKPSLT